jgi:glutamate-ammonia-ligase adenylyltransferase
MAICKARCFVGPRQLRRRLNETLAQLIRESGWHSRMADEIRELRLAAQQTSAASNLKRGEGGTLDVEMIAQMLTLKHAGDCQLEIRTGTTNSLQTLADAGVLAEEQTLALIGNYRVLRRIEASLRLMDTPYRHQFPDGWQERRHLAFLMNEQDPEMILAQCQNARRNNRRLFDELVR